MRRMEMIAKVAMMMMSLGIFQSSLVITAATTSSGSPVTATFIVVGRETSKKNHHRTSIMDSSFIMQPPSSFLIPTGRTSTGFIESMTSLSSSTTTASHFWSFEEVDEDKKKKIKKEEDVLVDTATTIPSVILPQGHYYYHYRRMVMEDSRSGSSISQSTTILSWIHDTIHGTLHSLMQSFLRSVKDAISKTFLVPWLRVPSSSSGHTSSTYSNKKRKEKADDAVSSSTTSFVPYPTTTTTSQSTGHVELLPQNRSALAASHIDLSGTWKPIITTQFLQEYDDFLKNCSQPYMLRQVVKQGLQYHIEHILQTEHGRLLNITGSNPLGQWQRTLIASDANENGSTTTAFPPMNVTLNDPDGDTVHIEAWWDEYGTKHTSWLRGKPRLHGGAMETIRYLTTPTTKNEERNKNKNDDVMLVCESIFHPSPSAPPSMKFRPGRVVWKYQKHQGR